MSVHAATSYYAICDVCEAWSGSLDGPDDTAEDAHGNSWRHERGWQVCWDCTPEGIQDRYDRWTRLAAHHYFTLFGVDPDRAAEFAVTMLDAGEFPPPVPPADLLPPRVTT